MDVSHTHGSVVFLVEIHAPRAPQGVLRRPTLQEAAPPANQDTGASRAARRADCLVRTGVTVRLAPAIVWGIIGVMHARMGGVLVALSVLVTPAFAGITGTVMNADGVPVAEAQVTIHGYETLEARRGRLMSETPEPVPLAATRTNAKGAFTLESPKNAAVWLYVSASGYGPESRRVQGNEDAGAIVMRKGATGRGVITSGDGKPVASATVVVHYDDGRLEYVTKTNAAGRYEAPDPKRASAIAVLHPDYAVDEQTAANEPLTERDLTRRLAAGTKVTGRVVAADGRTPVANATLFINSWPEGKSGEEGTFTIAHAPVRWSTLVARSEGLIGQVPFAKKDAYTLQLAKAATVSGRVTDVKSKVPVAGAIVRAVVPVPPLSLGDAPAGETDAKGGYSIVVPAGAYVVFTSRPGYDVAYAEVSVGAGQQVTRHFTVPQLARVSGTVLDEEKRPVAAAGIASIDAGAPMQSGVLRMMRSTDPVFSGPDGRFTTDVVPDEPLSLTAAKRGFPFARSEQLHAAPGERKKDVVLTIPRGIAVTGRITDGNGEPLSGVAVFAMETDGDRSPMYRMMMPGAQAGDDAVRTASDGTFALRVTEGRYDFHFRREGYVPKNVAGQSIERSARVDAVMEAASEIAGRVVRGGNGVEGVSLTVFGAESQGGAVTGPDGAFTVSGLEAGSVQVMLRKESDFIQEMRKLTSPARDAVIELAAGGRVTGRVVDRSTGKPLTAFQAGISSTSTNGIGSAFMGSPQMRDFSAEDGTFAIDNVPAGSMFVVAGARGYAPARLNVAIEEGKTVSDVELQLEAGVHLTGRVTGPDGTPLSDASVHVETPGDMSWRPEGAVTDTNGEYSLEMLPAGEGTVTFSHPIHLNARRQVSLKGRETKLDVQLAAGERVSGIVVTEAGAPVAGARVEAHDSGAAGGALTNAEGAFEVQGLLPGHYRFSASGSGAGEGSVEDVEVPGGQQVRITIRAGATIYGRILGLPPEELAMTSVVVSGDGNNVSGSVDSSGNYRLPGAPSGTVRVYADVRSHGGGPLRASQMRTVEVQPGGSEEVDLTFVDNHITIRGRVVRDGKPLADAQVIFMPQFETTQRHASGSTDEAGVYSVTGVEEGEYQVQVDDAQNQSGHSTTYTVRGSGTFDVEYRTGSVRGTVVDADTGEPLANATVQFRSSAVGLVTQRSVATDDAGAFVSGPMPPGSYAVSSSKDGYAIDIRQMAVTVGGEELQVKLSRGQEVTLKTVDGRNGQPVRAMAWVLDAQNRMVNDTSGSAGRATDEGEVKFSLAPGSYTASVRANGYVPMDLRIQSPSPPLVVALTAGGTIRVKSKHAEVRVFRLLDANGLAYSRLENAQSSHVLLPHPEITELPMVAPGTYTLQLLGYEEKVVDSVPVTVREGGLVVVEI
jgi:protocatechuate 3,4-dioxygenase beta subunit